MIVTKSKICPIAEKSTRIVHGGRGDYMEIAPEDIIMNFLHIPSNQWWRQSNTWRDKVYYDWYESDDGVKLYHQKKTVGYADYLIGYWYVLPNEVEETDAGQRQELQSSI